MLVSDLCTKFNRQNFVVPVLVNGNNNGVTMILTAAKEATVMVAITSVLLVLKNIKYWGSILFARYA